MRMGAKCTIVNYNPGWAAEKVEVWGMTRGGHMARTWIDTRDLGTFRAKWMPERADGNHGRWFDTKAEAAEFAAWLEQKYASAPPRDLRPTPSEPEAGT
jgi:hypothetical protein